MTNIFWIPFKDDLFLYASCVYMAVHVLTKFLQPSISRLFNSNSFLLSTRHPLSPAERSGNGAEILLVGLVSQDENQCTFHLSQ